METKRFEDLEFQQLECESRQDEEKETHTQQLLREMADYQRSSVNRKASSLLSVGTFKNEWTHKKGVNTQHYHLVIFSVPLYVEYVFKILTGTTSHSQEAGHPDHSAGSTWEGKLLEREEQSWGNVAEGIMKIPLLLQKNASMNLPILCFISSIRKKRN